MTGLARADQGIRVGHRPEAADVHRVFNDAIVDEPISSQQPAMATKPAAPCPYRIHVWKPLNVLQVPKNFVALCLGQFVRNFPNGSRPDDFPAHRLLLLAVFARERRTTSSWGITRPALMSAADSARFLPNGLPCQSRPEWRGGQPSCDCRRGRRPALRGACWSSCR